MIAEEEITEAEAKAEEAEKVLDRAEAHHAEVGSPTASSELLCAKADAHAARDRVRRLRAAWAKYQAAKARRTAAEGVVEQQRKAIVERLERSRDEAADAVAVLDRAVAEALRRVGSYTALVRQTSDELKTAGLRAGEGSGDGGASDGSLRLGGETWRPADAVEVVAYLVASGVAAEHPSHPFAMQRYTGSLAAKRGRDELLAALAKAGAR